MPTSLIIYWWQISFNFWMLKVWLCCEYMLLGDIFIGNSALNNSCDMFAWKQTWNESKSWLTLWLNFIFFAVCNYDLKFIFFWGGGDLWSLVTEIMCEPSCGHLLGLGWLLFIALLCVWFVSSSYVLLSFILIYDSSDLIWNCSLSRVIFEFCETFFTYKMFCLNKLWSPWLFH